MQLRLICTAAEDIENLMDKSSVSPTDHASRILMDDLKLTKDTAVSTIFTGEDEKFAFRRTQSRLNEMRTLEYWNAATAAADARVNVAAKKSQLHPASKT